MVEIKNLTKSYGDNVVLDDVSLTLEKGDRIAVMGSSGKGKTTLLRIIAGLEKPDSGEINISGTVAYMFQEPRLLPWRNAADNVKSVLPKEHRALADKYLDATGLADAKKKYPRELSGGMAQRVAFARFLAYAEAICAEVLVLDEPFSALDKETYQKMIELLLDISKSRTVIFVTHDIEQAKKITDNIINI